MRRTLFTTSLYLVLLTSGASAGQSASGPNPSGPENTEAYRTAYSLMSLSLDGCGDNELADLYRRAVVEKIASCPFSETAKSEFSDWAKRTLSRQEAYLKRFIETQGRLPDKVLGSDQTCKALRTSPAFVELSQTLDDFKQRKIGVDAVFPEPCFVGAGAL
jgi:hypothetical protein